MIFADDALVVADGMYRRVVRDLVMAEAKVAALEDDLNRERVAASNAAYAADHRNKALVEALDEIAALCERLMSRQRSQHLNTIRNIVEEARRGA